MNLKDIRAATAVVSMALILVVAAPVLGLFVSFEGGTERFSELWILGPGHMAEDYPFNIRANQPYSVFVGVGNHMGSSSRYMIYVKFRNQTQSLPNATASIPSPLPPLFEFQFFTADGGTWEVPVSFSFLYVSRSDDSILVGSLSVNDAIFPVNSSANWDTEYKGFYYQLFFELWLYNRAAQRFQFHNRFVGIWLNMTA